MKSRAIRKSPIAKSSAMGDFCWDHLPATCFFDALHVDDGLDEVAGLILHEEQGVLQVFEPMEFMG